MKDHPYLFALYAYLMLAAPPTILTIFVSRWILPFALIGNIIGVLVAAYSLEK